MGFSGPQQAHFRPLVERAWHVHCNRTGRRRFDRAARDAWYRQNLMESVGTYTTKELNQVSDFDEVMLHFAIIADDKYWIDRLSQGDERRMRYLIKKRLSDLDELDPFTKHTWDYARATYAQMGLPKTIETTPARLLWKVFQALDTHVRQLDRLPLLPWDSTMQGRRMPMRAAPRQPDCKPVATSEKNPGHFY